MKDIAQPRYLGVVQTQVNNLRYNELNAGIWNKTSATGCELGERVAGWSRFAGDWER